MNVAIVGAGHQCRRRAPIICECPETKLVAIASLDQAHARVIASQMGCQVAKNWQEIISWQDIDIVVVCTPPHVHATITIAALRSGKHVLCEKPLSKTLQEAKTMVAVAKETGRVLKCGFNHRHHPAIWEAKYLVDRGTIGKPIFGRCRYGICGRPGYESEWRADPQQAAGGQLIEQGSHAIDLFRWFLGEISEVGCLTSIQYFKNQPLEDNGMVVFRTVSGVTASLHASLTQWRNLFSFEVFGEDGYVIVEGLGGGYGTERLIMGRRIFNAPFQQTVTEYRGGDVSWREEWKEFLSAIKEGREPIGCGQDGLAAMQVALGAYEAEKDGRILKLQPVVP